jgi:hypothetical protein
MKKAAFQRLFSCHQAEIRQRRITASFLRAFARQQVLRERLVLLHRRQERRALQQVLAQRQELAQQQERALAQGLLLFCRKRSGRRQWPTGQRSTGSCSW